MRVLSTGELNRALLARQLLLERSDLSLNDAIERVGGLQTQYAPSAYIGLWSRLHGFRRETLTQALEQRRVVQGTLMRVTIHIVSARDYPLFAEGIRRERRQWWRRVQRHQVEGLDMQAVAALLRERLESGPRRQAELTELLMAQAICGSRGRGRGCGSTWCASRPRAPGRSAAPTCMDWRGTGSGGGR